MPENMADSLSDLLIYSLLFAAIVIGWLLGKMERRRRPAAPSNPLTREYFQGINLLLNDKRDEAVDVLLKSLEINSETADTYLVMGSLFRQRGEVDRAIRIHQDLLARPNLTKEQQATVRLELARDFLKAGLLDRSERLLKELVDEGSQHASVCQSLLLTIFEQEKEWQQAADIAEQLNSKGNETLHTQLAHYYCELAEQAAKLDDAVEIRSHLRKALAADKNCVRASMLEGKIEEKLGNHKDAIKAYKRIKQQDPRYLPETLVPLERCHKALGEERDYIKYLFSCIEDHPAVSLVIALSESVREVEGDKAGAYVLAEYLKKRPSVKGLHRLIDYHMQHSAGDAKDNLGILKAFTSKLIEHKPVYRCGHCGYEGKLLHWHCPSCHRWGTILPIQGLEGE